MAEIFTSAKSQKLDSKAYPGYIPPTECMNVAYLQSSDGNPDQM